MKEPPPLESVTTFPDCDKVCGDCVGKVTLFPLEIDNTFPLKANDCASVSVSVKVGKVTLFPFEIDKTFPLKANDCASVSVNVGKVNDPPPLERVITFPDCDKV